MRITGREANDFIAREMVRAHGERALYNVCGPAREAVLRALEAEGQEASARETPPGITFALREEERQTLILALAQLSRQRPGWYDHLEGIAVKLGGRLMFEQLRSLPAPEPAPPTPTDMVK